jgi:XRE family transcriptional regulator, aerobic/anaerobic benzoate catabolism transcriptional regulator
LPCGISVALLFSLRAKIARHLDYHLARQPSALEVQFSASRFIEASNLSYNVSALKKLKGCKPALMRIAPADPGRLDQGDTALKAFAERVRQARARRGITRKTLARDSKVSERYLAQIEGGRGNISLLVMRDLARALGLPLEVLVREGPEPPIDSIHAAELLRSLSQEDLRIARQLLRDRFGSSGSAPRNRRIALIGLRGAGKSTLGPRLAEHLRVPFLELDRLIEQESGSKLSLIFDFHGQSGFRKLERQSLEKVLDQYPQFVLATGGSLVSEAGTFERLQDSCLTVWVRTTPEEHMSRVIKQGDMRPMSDNREAIDDLKRILKEREVLYSKADMQIDTSGHTVQESMAILIGELERISV